MIPRTAGLKRSFILWTASAINSICRLLYGWTPMLRIFRSFPKYVFLRITLLKFWILIILKFRLLKKIKNGAVALTISKS